MIKNTYMYTTIRISKENKERLDELKLAKGETYDSVILRLYNTYEILLEGRHGCNNNK